MNDPPNAGPGVLRSAAMAPSECVGAAPSRPLCVPSASCTLTHTSMPARPAFRVGTHTSARALARATRPASPGCTLLCAAAGQKTARQGSATKTIQQLEGGAQRNSHAGIRMRHGALRKSKLSWHALLPWPRHNADSWPGQYRSGQYPEKHWLSVEQQRAWGGQRGQVRPWQGLQPWDPGLESPGHHCKGQQRTTW